MKIRVLGPFEVVDGDQPISLAGRRQQALLAMLALRAGEVVSVSRLIDDLWPERPPDSALNTLQAYVSRLRRALRVDPTNGGGEGIRYEHGGYVLDLPKDQIDSYRFEHLVGAGERHANSGEFERAGSVLREGLALWRGPALADFAHEPFAQAEIVRLEELRLAAIEARIDVDLECGRHAVLVPELEALVTEEPHREGSRRQLMIALYRSGRQGEALQVYTDARATLDEELGIEPTPELHELQRAILRHDPALAPPAPSLESRPTGSRTHNRPRTWVAGLAVAVLLALVAAGILLRPTHGSVAVHVVQNSVAVVDAQSNRVVDDVVVGDYPGPVAAGSGSVWVGNIGDSTVTQIDAETRETQFPGSAQRPVDLAVTEDALWIANASDFETEPPTGGGTVARRDFDAGALEVTRLGRRGQPDEAGTFVASDSRTVWAANTDSRTVARLDLDTGRILTRVRGLAGAGIATGYGAAWVPEPQRDRVVRLNISTGKVEARIPVSGNPRRTAAGEGGIWVITTGSHSAVWRIDPRNNETVAVIPVPPKARRIAAGSGYVWVTSGRNDEEKVRRRGMLSKIDPRTNGVVASIELGFRPDGVAVAKKRVWVAIAPL